MNTEIIYPLIVPSGYYNKDVWDLPHKTFPNTDYILTWVFFQNENSMTYIKRDEFNLLNNSYPNWQQIAFENLRTSGDHFYTRFRIDKNTGLLSFIIFSNEDGIGSSRVLLSEELSKGFPEGYYISFPDRAVGIAISQNISPSENNTLNESIHEYYGCSGTAMTKSIYIPSEFSLPANWIEPVDKEVSAWMVKEMHEYKRS